MYCFDLQVQALPVQAIAGPMFEHGGRTWPTLLVRADKAATLSWIAFDDALAALEALPRMYVEPDGSFLWVGEQGSQRWQVDGNLYDGGDALAYVDLKGDCPDDALDNLLRCLGWPGTELVFQLKRVGVFVDEDTFRAISRRVEA